MVINIAVTDYLLLLFMNV